MDPRALIQAIRKASPGSAVVPVFYGPLVADPNGAMFTALADPGTGQTIATVQLGSVIPLSTRALVTGSAVYGQDPDSEDFEAATLVQVTASSSGTQTPVINGLSTASAIMLSDPLDSNVFIPLERGLLNLDAQPDNGFALWALASLSAFNGSSFDRVRTASAITFDADTASIGAQLATRPAEWTLTNAPAANTDAFATRAATANGERHVLTSICCDLNAVAALAAPISIVVRDGPVGVGTVLWQRRLIAPAGFTASVEISGLNIAGSPDTAMTVETNGGPGATNFVTLSATGYTVAAP
jgi:hypothetical protein